MSKTRPSIPAMWQPGSLPDRINAMLRDNPGDIHDVQATLHVLVAYWSAVDKGALDQGRVKLHIERLEAAWNDHAFGVYETNRDDGGISS